MAIHQCTGKIAEFVKEVVAEWADAEGYKRPYAFTVVEIEGGNRGVRMEMSDSTLPVPNSWGTNLII